MVNWIWLIVATSLGGSFGVLLMAIIIGGTEHDKEDDDAENHSPR